MNKHPYIGWTTDDQTPRHIVGGPLTGWAWSDTVRQHKCPKCGSDPGYECESAKGRKVWPPHMSRVDQLTDEQFNNCRGKTLTRSEHEKDTDCSC
jgi:hypothetical protein